MPSPVYNSINEFPGDGVTTQYEFNFAGGYISRTHVKAYVTDEFGVITDVTITDPMWVNDNTLDLGVAAVTGGITRIYRDTPRDAPLVNFQTGSRITEANLDLLARQTVLGVAEAFDAGAYVVAADLLGTAAAALAAAEAAVAATSASQTAAAASAAAALASQVSATASAIAAGASQAAAEAARDDPAVQTVYTNIASINTVAANIASVNSVAEVSAEVTTVAGIAADVTAVSAVADEVAVVATNLLDVTNFADVYQGPKATDPTLRNGGAALQNGDLYFNTATSTLRVYSVALASWRDGNTDAALVGYTPAGTGAVPTTVQAKLRQYVTPLDFGAVGDGVTDDYTALVAAIDYGRTSQLPVNGLGRVYKVNTGITVVPYKINDLTIDGSAIVGTYVWQTTGATLEASKLLGADTRQNGRVFSVVAHGFSAGDVVLVKSTLVVETATSSVATHWGRVTSAGADTFTTAESACVNLLTANAAAVQRMPSVTAALDNITVIGGASCKNGLRLNNFVDIILRGVTTRACAQRGLTISECFNARVHDITAYDSSEDGLGYGVVIAGCGEARVDVAKGSNCRHVFTCGASGTTGTTGGSCGDVVGTGCLGAVLDTHPAVFGFTSTGRTVGDMDTGVGEDGVTWQASGGTMDVELAGNVARHGVLVQTFHVAAAFDVPPTFVVTLKSTAAIASRGVMCDLSAGKNVGSLVIHVDAVSVLEACMVLPGANAVDSIAISGRGKSTSTRGCYVSGVAASDVGYVSIKGLWQASALEAAYVLGGTDAGVRTTDASFSGGKAFGGTYGIRVGNKVQGIVGDFFKTGSTGPTIASPAPATLTLLT